MQRKNLHRLQFDALENRALLATVPLLSQVPGGGVATPTSSADTLAMQQDASTNNMELLLAQTDLLLGTNTNVSQYAALLMRDHNEAAFELQTLANSQGVILPSNLSPSDQIMADQALATLVSGGAAKVDTNFLTLMVQMHEQAIATFQQQLSTTTDPGFAAFLTKQLPVLQLHLSLAQSLLAGPTTITPSTPPVAGPQTLSTSDTQVLSTAYSSSWLERYISEVASALASGESQSQPSSGLSTFQQYTTGVINDHATEMFNIQMIASGTNTPLPAGLQPSDAQIATQLLATLNLANPSQSELAYLTTVISVNEQDITQSQTALGSVQNTSLSQVLQSGIASDTLHISGAQSIASTLEYPTPIGHHARAVVRAYEKLFGRDPTWAELYYYTNMIRANPRSLAWYKQLEASPDGQIDYVNGKFGSYSNGSVSAANSGSSGSALANTKASKSRTATLTSGQMAKLSQRATPKVGVASHQVAPASRKRA